MGCLDLYPKEFWENVSASGTKRTRTTDGPPASRRLDGQKLLTSANPSLSYGSTDCERNSLILAGPETNFDHAGRRRKESVLEEVVVHDQLSRTEHVFRDRINSYDDEQMKSACNRMNFEIMACTQSIVDEWSQLRPDSKSPAGVRAERGACHRRQDITLAADPKSQSTFVAF